MIVDPEYRHGSLRQQRGHDWQPTSQQGRFHCQTCGAKAVCPGCLPIIPVGVLRVSCDRHTQRKDKEETQQQPEQRRRYQPPSPPDMLKDGTPSVTTLRTSRARQVNTTAEWDTEPPITRLRHRPRFTSWLLRSVARHWFALTVAVLLVVSLVWVLQSWILPTWNGLQDQWHTGDGRITQFDAGVGHGGTSHFLAEFYKGQVFVVEFPGESAKHAHVYGLPVAESVALAHPVLTLSVRDMNHDGQLDLLIQIEGDDIGHVLYNNGAAFQTTIPQS